MVDSFNPISWGDNEPIDTGKLNTMANNTQYLFERAARAYYNAYGIQRDAGIKIACGVTTIPPTTNAVETVAVYFGTFFTPGCQPIIVTGLTSPYNRGVIETTYGLSGVNSQPDDRGFNCTIVCRETTTASNHIYKTMHLNWIAMGY